MLNYLELTCYKDDLTIRISFLNKDAIYSGLMLAKSKGLKTGVINIDDSNFYNFQLCSRSLPLEQFLLLKHII